MKATGLKPEAKPWEMFQWKPTQQQNIYMQWGSFYMGKSKTVRSIKCFDYAVAHQQKLEYKALMLRSRSKRQLGELQSALEDSLLAQEIAKRLNDTHLSQINQDVCDALFELNCFEECKAELHKNLQKFPGQSSKKVQDRLKTVDCTLKATLGKSYHAFNAKSQQIILKAAKIHTQTQLKNEKGRRYWKNSADDICDVTSIKEIEKPQPLDLQFARNNLRRKIFHNTYLKSASIDVDFLRMLNNNPQVWLPANRNSSPYLRQLTADRYNGINLFLKALHAREPLYFLNFVKCHGTNICEKNCQDNLNRIQQETRLTCIRMLSKMRTLRHEGNIEELTKYVEDMMGKYFALKTSRILPWKFEFVNEVYNMLALAFTDNLEVPKDFVNQKMAIFKLLKITAKPFKDLQDIQSVRRLPPSNEHVSEMQQAKYREQLDHMEKRLYNAKFSIERCYIIHEIARLHFKNQRYDECCSVAHKGIKETKNCSSLIWRFLNILLICKASAVKNKLESLREALDAGLIAAKRLKNGKLIELIKVCQSTNNINWNLRKKHLSLDAMRKRKRKSLEQMAYLGYIDSKNERYGSSLQAFAEQMA